MSSKPLFEWTSVLFEYVGFTASFSMLGAIGFRFAILRSSLRDVETNNDQAFDRALSRAAHVGLVGVALGVASLIEGLLKRADSKHITFAEAFSAGGPTVAAQTALLGVLLVSFFLARRRLPVAWQVAGVATIAFTLRNVLSGRLKAMVNPLHVLGGGLWIGTLFVLVVCGVREMMHASVTVEARESAVATMVRRFSPLALFGAGLLGLTGVTTAWTHLKRLDALWTTPYGYVLDAKLVVVGLVLLLGAWNWRRVGPALGHDGGAKTIHRTASLELAVAAIVLGLTSVLVSVPSPK
ncbi:MAG: copper resistance D family protein [Polyangiales bacterium]